MRARSDCFKMRVTRRRKSTCLSLTRNPRWLFLERICIHLLTPTPLFALSSLEGVCTHQVFPVARDASPLYDWTNALSLFSPLCRSQAVCFWHSSPRLSRRARDFTCFIVRASWSGFISACNIGRLDHRKSLVSRSTQLLFCRATTSFVFVHGGCHTHT